MQLCVTAFVGQLSMELSVQAEKDKCKTIGNEQVLHSLESLGFDQLVAEVKQVAMTPLFHEIENEGSRSICIRTVTL